MTTDLRDERAKLGLERILEHIKTLCGGRSRHYHFLLDLLAHSVQYPDIKVGRSLSASLGRRNADASLQEPFVKNE